MKRPLGLLVMVAVLSGPLLASAQEAEPSDQSPQFEETVIVTATPRPGSASDYFLTFSGPVSVPGVSLAPGTYVFSFPSEGGNVVQVLKADRSDAYAMFHTIPVRDLSRDLFTEGHSVTLREREAGAPPAIAAWFPPRRSIGYEFIYPEDSGE